MRSIRSAGFTLFTILAAFLAACNQDRSRGGEVVEEPTVSLDLSEILQRDTLVAILEYNSTSYFLYRGEPMGYEYELLREFAEDAGVELRVMVAQTPDSALSMLNRGTGDIVAARLFPTQEWESKVAYTVPIHTTEMVVVQRTSPPGSAPTTQPVQRLVPEDTAVVSAKLVQNPAQLAGQKVHVREQTAASERLIELSDSITGDIHVVEVDPAVSTEALIRKVAQGGAQLHRRTRERC